MIQASRRGGDDIQCIVAGSSKDRSGRIRAGDESRERNVEFLGAVGSDGSTKSGYINAIQPNLHGSSTETGAKNSHRTDGLGRGAQRDFRRRAEVRRSADRRAVDRRSQHAFDVDGLNVAKCKAGERAAARVQRQYEIADGIHGDGSENGECRNRIGGSATYQHSRSGKASEAVLAGGNDGRTLQEGRIEQRDFVGFGIERDRGIGKRLEGHFGRAELWSARAHLTGLLGKERHGAYRLALRIDERNLAGRGIAVGENGAPRDWIDGNSHDRGRNGVGQKWTPRTGDTAGGASGGIVFVGLEILKMSGIENLADRKRSVEIGFVCASRGQAADEHGARIAGIEIVSGGGRYGDNVGGARGAGNSDGSGGWIGQVHSRKQACSSRSHINQTRAGLKRDLRICSSIQRN